MTDQSATHYRRRAEAHRPTDEATLRAAAVELRHCGLTHHDIGLALGLDPTAVRELLMSEARELRHA